MMDIISKVEKKKTWFCLIR